MKSAFAKEVHRAMSMCRVNKDDLALLMGYRWKHWLYGPTWDNSTGWFYAFDQDPDRAFWLEPTDRAEQLRILNLIKTAQDNAEFWRHKYYNAKSFLKIYAKGIQGGNRYTAYWQRAYRKAMVWTPRYWWSRITNRPLWWWLEVRNIWWPKVLKGLKGIQ